MDPAGGQRRGQIRVGDVARMQVDAGAGLEQGGDLARGHLAGPHHQHFATGQVGEQRIQRHVLVPGARACIVSAGRALVDPARGRRFQSRRNGPSIPPTTSAWSMCR